MVSQCETGAWFALDHKRDRACHESDDDDNGELHRLADRRDDERERRGRRAPPDQMDLTLGEFTTPFGRIDIGDRLREYPPVSVEILGGILSFAIRKT
jgi:hypothetical protein